LEKQKPGVAWGSELGLAGFREWEEPRKEVKVRISQVEKDVLSTPKEEKQRGREN